MRVSWSGTREFHNRMMAAKAAPRLVLQEIGIAAVGESKRLVPRKTGNLGRTIRLGNVTNTMVEVRAGGTVSVGYAAAVELGSRPHIIVPVRARVLAWGGERTLGGRVRKGSRPTHFARRVRHPGTKPRPYLLPGLRWALDKVGLGSVVKSWNGAA